MSKPPDVRRRLADLPRYVPEGGRCAIDLSDNTNLWGAPPAARAAARLEEPSIARYPDAYAGTLKEAAARYLGLPASYIVTGCGSDDVIDAAIRAFARPGARLALPDPSFVMLPVFAHLSFLEPVPVPLTSDYDVDVDRMLASGASVVYLCSPNNPTGTSFSRAAIDTIADRARGLVIVDEAYAEFAGRSAVDLVERSDRVLVTRTMSKAFGLAGLRVGYAAGAPSLIAQVEKVRGPFKVTSVAERAAAAALTDNRAWVRDRVHLALENRGLFVAALRELGLEPLPSDANFVLVPVREATGVASALRARGVAVRSFERLACAPGTPLAATSGDALRITIGPWDLLEPALAALREVIA